MAKKESMATALSYKLPGRPNRRPNSNGFAQVERQVGRRVFPGKKNLKLTKEK